MTTPSNSTSPITEDAKIKSLRQATVFIESVRRKREETSQSLRGGSGLKEETLAIIASAHDANSFADAISTAGVSKEDTLKLVKRFEEMCRRLKIVVLPELRHSIITILSGELYSNHQAFDADAAHLLPATLYQGSLTYLPEEAEFASLKDSPFVFKRAVIGSPTDPREYLRKVIETVSRLSTDERFREFADSPYIFKYAAAHNSASAEDLLVKLSTSIKSCANDTGFSAMTRSNQIRYAAQKIGVNLGDWKNGHGNAVATGAGVRTRRD